MFISLINGLISGASFGNTELRLLVRSGCSLLSILGQCEIYLEPKQSFFNLVVILLDSYFLKIKATLPLRFKLSISHYLFSCVFLFSNLPQQCARLPMFRVHKYQFKNSPPRASRFQGSRTIRSLIYQDLKRPAQGLPTLEMSQGTPSHKNESHALVKRPTSPDPIVTYVSLSSCLPRDPRCPTDILRRNRNYLVSYSSFLQNFDRASLHGFDQHFSFSVRTRNCCDQIPFTYWKWVARMLILHFCID